MIPLIDTESKQYLLIELSDPNKMKDKIFSQKIRYPPPPEGFKGEWPPPGEVKKIE
jgi:hypothetical protein